MTGRGVAAAILALALAGQIGADANGQRRAEHDPVSPTV